MVGQTAAERVEVPRYRFMFLQHGVIKDDISRWLNSKRISLMLTSTPAEYKSIIDPSLTTNFQRRKSC